MSGLNFSSDRPAISDSLTNISDKRKTRWGCNGCFAGCLLIILLPSIMALVFGIYVYTADKDQMLGRFAIGMFRNQSAEFNITASLNQNPNISDIDKIRYKVSYDNLLSEYDKLPEDQKTKVNKDIGVLIKKFMKDPGFLKEGAPPPEMQTLMDTFFPKGHVMEEFQPEDIPEEKIWLSLIAEHDEETNPQKSKRRRRRRR